MKSSNGDTYRVHEFAALVGVTARTLHHYDRVGLLKPLRTQSGYRIYAHRHLERLEQIIALKFVGLSLKQIQDVLDHNALDLSEALRSQRRILEQRKQQLDRAIAAIGEAEAAFDSGQRPNSALLKKIIEVLEMENNQEWLMSYYSEDARKAIRERGQTLSKEQQEQVASEWQQLYRDIDAVAEKDPASPEAQALAARWMKLIESFTGGNAEVLEGMKKLYADQANWPSGFSQQMAPYRFQKPEADAFIQQAIPVYKASA